MTAPRRGCSRCGISPPRCDNCGKVVEGLPVQIADRINDAAAVVEVIGFAVLGFCSVFMDEGDGGPITGLCDETRDRLREIAKDLQH